MDFSSDNLTAIEAGKPYIVKWTSGENITDPIFNDVKIINQAPTAVECGVVSFQGVYNPYTIRADAGGTVVCIGANNKLFQANAESILRSFRAYFLLNATTTDAPAGIRAFVLNFGDEATGITTINDSEVKTADSNWYTLDGRRLAKQPIVQGVYIFKGKKIIIK